MKQSQGPDTLKKHKLFNEAQESTDHKCSPGVDEEAKDNPLHVEPPAIKKQAKTESANQ